MSSINSNTGFGYGATYGGNSDAQSRYRGSRETEKLQRILVNDPNVQPIEKGHLAGGQLEYTKQVTNENLQRSMDAENILKLLPDVKKAKQILISTILSPKDMITVSPAYNCNSEVLPPDVTAEMTRIVKLHLEKVYKIEAKMQKVLEDALFDFGSHVSVIVSKSRIDSLINSDRTHSNESYLQFTDPKILPAFTGLLGDPKSRSLQGGIGRIPSLESYQRLNYNNHLGDNRLGVTITDNADVLKIKSYVEKWRSRREEDVYHQNRGHSLEGMGDLDINRSQLKRKVAPKSDKPAAFPTRWYESKLILDLEEDSKENEAYDIDDTPLMFSIPPEAFVTVHAPSDPTNIIGGFILADRYGSPIRRNSVKDFYSQLNQGMGAGAGSTSQMLGRMRSTLLDYGYSGGSSDHEVMYKIYTGIIANDVKRSIENGINGEESEIGSNDEAFRIMFARSCAQKQTQMIYVPKRFLTYFAFDYDDRGIGKSLLTDNAMIAGIRATILMSNMFATIRNSTNYRKVRIELNPNDPDPDGRVEQTIHEVSRATQQNMPMFDPNPVDIVNFLQNAGMSFEVTGHPRYATTTVEIANNQASNVEIDTEFSDRLQNDHMGALGVPGETVNAAMDVEFMRNVMQNHLLFTKGAIRHQKTLMPMITSDCQKFILANGKLLNELAEVVKKHREALKQNGITDRNTDIQIVNHYVKNLDITLPEPDITKIDIQMEEFDKYTEALEKFLPSFLSSDVVGNDLATQLGELGGNIDNITNIVKAYYQRKWLAEHGVMNELFDIVAQTEDDEPMQNILKDHLQHRDGLVRMLLPLIRTLSKKNELVNKELEKIGAEPSSDSDNSSSDDNSDNSGGESDETSGGDDDFDFGGGTGDDDGGDDLGGFDLGGDEGGGDNSGGESDEPGNDTNDDGNSNSSDFTDDDSSDKSDDQKSTEDDTDADDKSKGEDGKDNDTDDKPDEEDKDPKADLGGFKG